ncbi:hypothetical protein C5N99_00110 [Treponema medium]|uniref:Uncharacterized protein n=2 Tax=Treponema medium TaxID=58231 RepID=A0AA87NUV0_TREMD|nr:hypothetical protein [Treponema medium]EPF30009.1 hypothetical protein HMPREF9195_00020 [Treponema medium ATCC 700293]QSH91053.1 hypothetical protein C5N99_00110 [Treponema medium]QSH96189.1 hypothetical protein DWB79_00105 [Treponema medium]
MIGFFLKKNFFDGWDNFLPLALFNIAVILIVFLFFGLAYLLSSISVLSLLSLFVCIILLGVLLLATSNLMSRIADYKSFSFKEIGEEIKHTWLHGVLFAIIEIFCWIVAGVAVPYYFSFQNFLGLFLGVTVVWIFAVIQLSLLWFFPIRSRLESNFRKCLKKCFIVFFDNTGFTFFMLLYSVVLIILTPFLAFLVPGLSGILLAWNNAFKLRMYKYDWMEQHPEIPIQTARKQIPWDELLAEDRETVGSRSIRNLIFPWKD